ncbi:MAG: type II/IV secretion system ATPase subunit [Candidatus Aenigmatarchaeota archaeon]
MVFNKIRNLRGILYRKLIEKKETKLGKKLTKKKEEQALELPGFRIAKPSRIFELPEITDITKVNVIYPLTEPFAYANIKWNDQEKQLIYYVIEPVLTEDEKKILQRISDALVELVEIEISSVKETSKVIEYIKEQVLKIIKEFGITLNINQFLKIMYYIYKNFIGFNEIEPLLQDPHIEDISCDGVGLPIYIVHRKYGSIKTNIVFNDFEELRKFIVKLAQRSGRYVSYAEPILDGTLPDGSRVSATLAGDVATRGPTFTIRKFGEKPFSPIEQIELKTADEKIMAYLWYFLEHGASMLIVGGVATGKTSFLNSIAMFIPPEAKIVSIEDTREIRIPHEHWVPGLARVGFGIPLPTGEKYGEVSLFDLLKESFRQNPDYVIVGEVRGNEAYVMFQGMASGHPSISTFHAGSVDSVIKRLTTPPIELSPALLESLDLIIVMTHAREKGKSARRIKEIVEMIAMDTKTGEAKTNTLFKWNAEKDIYEKVNESIKLEKLVKAKGGKLEDALVEIKIREKILEWMGKQGIKDYRDVTKVITQYYKEPEKVLSMVGIKKEEFEEIMKEEPMKPKRVVEAKPEIVQPVEIKQAVKEREKKRTSIFELLGFKVLREK